MSTAQDTLAALKKAQGTPDELIKAFVQPGTATTGLQAYNLEAPSKKLFPILTPIRNTLSRVGGGFAIQANWKTITNINVNNIRAGVAEGLRGGIIDHQQNEVFAAFRGMGLENNVTFEAGYAAQGYEDVKALAVSTTLQALMVQEERTILGGNTSLALGTTPTPTTGTNTTGGTIAAGTYNVICVALGLQALLDLIGANNGAVGQVFNLATAAVPGLITRTNAGGGTSSFGGGNAQQSAAAGVTTTGSTSTISGVVTPVNGALGYAWFVGTAGAERLQAVTTINSVVVTALSGTSQLASAIPGGAADRSTSALEFDGLFTQCFRPGSNATVITQPNGVAGIGTGLTTDNAGGVLEFEQMFVQMYNRYRLSPTQIYINSQELLNLTRRVVQGQGAPLLQLISNVEGQTVILAGSRVANYMNKVTGDVIPVIVHPNVPPGTVFFYTDKVPYPLNGIPQVARMLLRQDYYQLEWPLVQRRYDYGVYFDGVLQHYFPPSMGIITNIGNV